MAAGGRIRKPWRWRREDWPVGALAGGRQGGAGQTRWRRWWRVTSNRVSEADLAGRSIPGDLVAGEVGLDAWLGTFLRD